MPSSTISSAPSQPPSPAPPSSATPSAGHQSLFPEAFQPAPPPPSHRQQPFLAQHPLASCPPQGPHAPPHHPHAPPLPRCPQLGGASENSNVILAAYTQAYAFVHAQAQAQMAQAQSQAQAQMKAMQAQVTAQVEAQVQAQVNAHLQLLASRGYSLPPMHDRFGHPALATLGGGVPPLQAAQARSAQHAAHQALAAQVRTSHALAAQQHAGHIVEPPRKERGAGGGTGRMAAARRRRRRHRLLRRVVAHVPVQLEQHADLELLLVPRRVAGGLRLL